MRPGAIAARRNRVGTLPKGRDLIRLRTFHDTRPPRFIRFDREVEKRALRLTASTPDLSKTRSPFPLRPGFSLDDVRLRVTKTHTRNTSVTVCPS